MEKHSYVTLFNLNYLNRGLVMYNSLKKAAKNFELYVICFDDATFEILSKLSYPDLIPVALKDFEDEELLKVKPTRSAAEYCWTCTPSVILYCINTFKLQSCAYLDADMFFYSDPEAIWKENKKASVFITLHNYSPAYDQSLESGRFCVQFVGFKNNEEGMKVLKDWRNKCMAWCYARIEDGKFGDQKYLDAWPAEFKGVHVVQNITAGLAPWNIQQFTPGKGKTVIRKSTNEVIQPVFFHFHGFKIFKDKTVSFVSHYYDLDKDVQNKIYYPYAELLLETDDFLQKKFKGLYTVKHAESEFRPVKFRQWLKTYLYDVKNSLKNINGNFTAARFKNNYTYKLK